jgi:hypothetical protein
MWPVIIGNRSLTVAARQDPRAMGRIEQNVTGECCRRATEFPASDISLAFTRLAWREIGSESPILRS